ncbi:hypothetical protein, partial [Kaarinaea lacus]
MAKSPKFLPSVTLVSIVLLASALWVSTGQALPTSGTAKVAISTSLDKTTISVANSELDASDASDTHASLTTRLLQAMPHLEQALIIFTSVNGLL